MSTIILKQQSTDKNNNPIFPGFIRASDGFIFSSNYIGQVKEDGSVKLYTQFLGSKHFTNHDCHIISSNAICKPDSFNNCPATIDTQEISIQCHRDDTNELNFSAFGMLTCLGLAAIAIPELS